MCVHLHTNNYSLVSFDKWPVNTNKIDPKHNLSTKLNTAL